MKHTEKLNQAGNPNHKLINQIKSELAALEMHIMLEKQKSVLNKKVINESDS
ncbi:hypothetical protein [Chondrinema litorale]|uniref:hypothetical protein n=1 Tax=Chondrinema litorale TaxID=2994555 RepID=UPI002542D324|nr:hypothetical protein [Chondrinema litorale]UZR95667.1 hypothetical protein OQ292_07570 [Chondrinema litorale]